MSTEVSRDRNVEKHIAKQMGCMSGFLKFLDRHQFLSTKRLPAPKNVDVSEKSSEEKFVALPALMKEPEKTKTMTFPIPELYKLTQPRSPEVVSAMPVEMQAKSPLPLHLIDVNEGGKNSWKFSPRLSLDSRATFDAAKGSLYRKEVQTNASDDNSRRSTSVIAKLMGIEAMPNMSSSEPVTKHVELRRSASESRVTREIFQSRLVDNSSDKLKVKQQSHMSSNVIKDNIVDAFEKSYVRSDLTLRGCPKRNFKSPQQRKSFYNAADIFPEPNQKLSIYGDIERRLKMRGIDEPMKDLETLKQILEAMQLKGLLHTKPVAQIRNKHNVGERNYSYSSAPKSPIVLMKPNPRVGYESAPSIQTKSDHRQVVSSVSPRPQRQNIDRKVTSPVRGRSNSLAKTKPLSIQTPKRVNESTGSRRVSPLSSPRRNVADQNRSPRNRRPATHTYAKDKIKNTVAVEDESSSCISESAPSTPSQTDSERCKTEFTEGRRLLNRCDKLLNSIADMNATESQPSPVSVLDSSFYKDDSRSPSPVMKRNISFPVEVEEETGSYDYSCVQSKCEDELDDPDFIYISQIFKAWNYASKEANNRIFVHLEKHHYLKCKHNSKLSMFHRRLIFDTVTEIMERSSHFPPWKSFSTKTWVTSRPSLQQIWLEMQKFREHQSSDDLFEVICGLLKKDLAGDSSNGWRDCPVEKSEAVLNIERLIFKDLVGESIRDLEELSAKSPFLASRRKLVF
ncbi:Protein LONGIFOLIA like [Heracleum sosnowskyi]|uniref:Protein LONGIFOLIA like n=1 Tax=Heracleum sosnowskyi TaxID=360622 RepID=A0AAD8GQU2_9APIA|nr:Protein LONGIFOLIA like [Heracleum sosnowskyi]